MDSHFTQHFQSSKTQNTKIKSNKNNTLMNIHRFWIRRIVINEMTNIHSICCARFDYVRHHHRC